VLTNQSMNASCLHSNNLNIPQENCSGITILVSQYSKEASPYAQ
jgi:hypothetical protein